MRIRKYIGCISLLLSLWSVQVRAQNDQFLVCAGDTGIAYYVQGFEQSTFEWSMEGGEIVRHYGDSIIVNWSLIPGEYRLTVQETSEFGCIGNLQSVWVQVAGPDIDLGDDTYICEGDAFEIMLEGDHYSYLWHDGSSGPGYITHNEGWISVAVTDSYGCALGDSLYLSVEDIPEVNLGNDTTLCGDQNLQVNAGPDGTIYSWSTGDIGQYITIYQDGEQEIWVTVEDENGCLNSDTLLIDACNVEFYFRDIPNAITANDDGVNDVWNISKLEDYSQAIVEIFDQWGTLTWKSEPGYPESWDGRDMRDHLVPVDSYHFVIHLNDGSNEKIIGYVTVIR